MGEKRNAYTVLVGKSAEKRSIGIDRSNIKMDLKEMGSEGMDLLDLARGMEERRPL